MPGLRTLSILVLILIAGCKSDDRKSLIVYSPHGKEMLRAAEIAFEARYPDIDVRWIDMGGQNAYDRISTEKQNPQASVWWGGAGPTFSRAASEGLLDAYEPSWSSAADSSSRDPDHYWYATFLTPEVILFNTRTVAEGERPRDWDDLLAPEWEDRVIIRYPLASSTMRTIWGALIMRQSSEEDGYAWLARLDRNTKTYSADPTQLYLKIAREEGDITFWNMPDSYMQTETYGYPFGFIIPESGTPVLKDGIALIKNGPNPAAGRSFYEFVSSDSALVDQANRFFRIPARRDIPRELLPDWMVTTEIRSMPIDWDRLTSNISRWMQYWDENIKGRGAAWLDERGLD